MSEQPLFRPMQADLSGSSAPMAGQKPPDQIIVIFGASGDLAARKLFPALCELFQREELPENWLILGTGRTSFSNEQFREHIGKALPEDCAREQEAFLKHLHYFSMQTSVEEDYRGLAQKLAELQQEYKLPGNMLFYLSVPPLLYQKAADFLAHAGLADQQEGFRRLIIEKPFGYDLKTAQELNHSLFSHWDENQIYRIDHYLGKETVQNLLVFRFANEIFDALWNRRYIDYVEITAAESIGVGARGGYFDGSGTTRDMVQNHLLQVLGMVALEPPVSFSARDVRNETMKVMQSLRPLPEDLNQCAVFGQYGPSRIKGKDVPGYREEPGIDSLSRTETFTALKLFIDNYRWAGVPFYLRAGKRLPTRVSEVVIHFKHIPHPAMGTSGDHPAGRNVLVIRIQPDEGILLKFGMKEPGSGFAARSVNMDFHYRDLGQGEVPDSYKRLLLDAMQGDATLYARGDAVEACWKFIDPLIRWRESGEAPVHGYPAGSWGPLEADELLKCDDREWRQPCRNLNSEGDYCEL